MFKESGRLILSGAAHFSRRYRSHLLYNTLPFHKDSSTFFPHRRLKNRATPQNKRGELDPTVTPKPDPSVRSPKPHIPDLALV